jgi:hypothetical protein
MAIVIGAMTTTGIDGSISAQWGVQAQMNRLWELGDWTPYKTIVTKVETAAITAYAGASSSVSLSPSISCSDSNATISITISPGTCGGGGSGGLSGKFFLMSYSYSKGDAVGLGQESWNGQRWPGNGGGGGGGDVLYTSAPSYVLQGPAEGSESGDVSSTGITFGGGPTVEGSQGSVSAGFPGLGQADSTIYGIVNNVGGGTLKQDGKIGQGSANIPHQPIWVG